MSILQSITSIALIVGLILAFIQLRTLVKSVNRSQELNAISAVSHCADRRERIIAATPSNKVPKDMVTNWWYQYWDLYTEEFILFKKGLLEPDIFELWISELTTAYTKKPNGFEHLECLRDTHELYLKTVLPSKTDLHKFFREVRRLSDESNDEMRCKLVHDLIKKSIKKGNAFKERFHR